MQIEPYNSAKTFSLITIGLLGAMALIDAFNVLASFAQLYFPYEIQLDDESMSIWIMMIGLLTILQFPVYIATIVFFLLWLNRSYRNLTPLGAQYLEHSSGWAVGYWFIPFVNLVRPFQVVREVWNQSDPDVDPTLRFSTAQGTPALLGFWWALWLLSNITTNISTRLDLTGGPREASIATAVYALANAFSVLAAIAAIMVVKGITDRQTERQIKVGQAYSQTPPPPPPTFN